MRSTLDPSAAHDFGRLQKLYRLVNQLDAVIAELQDTPLTRRHAA